MNSLKRIKGHHRLITSIFSFIIIAAPLVNLAYGQASQMESNTSNNNTNANSIDIRNISAKKVQVGDIDIVYKTFDKGDPILLINGYSFAMDSWDPTLLETLASNHTVIIFDNRGITQPTLVIVGTDDAATPAANSVRMTELIPGSWLVQIKGGGHGLMYQYPEQFSNIVETFLENTNTQ